MDNEKQPPAYPARIEYVPDPVAPPNETGSAPQPPAPGPFAIRAAQELVAKWTRDAEERLNAIAAGIAQLEGERTEIHAFLVSVGAKERPVPAAPPAAEPKKRTMTGPRGAVRDGIAAFIANLSPGATIEIDSVAIDGLSKEQVRNAFSKATKAGTLRRLTRGKYEVPARMSDEPKLLEPEPELVPA